jgi:hypothetical protein
VSDVADVYARLRAETAKMLGYDIADLTAVQTLRLDLAASLRLEIDRITALQMRGEPADLRALTSAAESLEKLLHPEVGPTGNASEGAREEFARLLDGLAGAAEHVEHEETTRLRAEVAELRVELARSRAGAVPPAPTTPSAEIVPLRPDPAEVAKAREAARIKAEMTKPRDDEPWRPFVDASGIRTSHGNFNVHGIPKGW